MRLTPEEDKVVKDVLRVYLAGYEVWAFGSRVTGKRLKKTSDLDLVVISNPPLSAQHLMQIKDAFSLALVPFRVDVLDWSSVSESFRQIIQQDYEVIQQRPILWDKVFTHLDDMQSKKILPGLHARILHTGFQTTIFWRIDKDANLPEHSHHNEQTVILTKGEFELSVDGSTKRMKVGDLAVIAPHKKHSGRAITDCEITDIFYPIREDLIQGSNIYA